jgi:hypothetical protein
VGHLCPGCNGSRFARCHSYSRAQLANGTPLACWL